MDNAVEFHKCLNSKNLDPLARLTIIMHYNILELSVKKNTEQYKAYKEIMKEIEQQ